MNGLRTKNFLFRIFSHKNVANKKIDSPPFLSLFGKVCGRPPQNKTKQEEEDEEEGILPHHIPIIIIIIITKMTTT